MRFSFVLLTLIAAFCCEAIAQPVPAPATPPSPASPQAEPSEPPHTDPVPLSVPAPSQPPSPEATTPANPLQHAPTTEVSPPSAPVPGQPLPPAATVAPPLEQKAQVSQQTAAYLQEIGIDPNAPDVVEVSQDSVGEITLDSLAAERDEAKVRRFIYTRTFMHRFLADSKNLSIEPDKYDIAFLTPDEVKLITDDLNK